MRRHAPILFAAALAAALGSHAAADVVPQLPFDTLAPERVRTSSSTVPEARAEASRAHVASVLAARRGRLQRCLWSAGVRRLPRMREVNAKLTYRRSWRAVSIRTRIRPAVPEVDGCLAEVLDDLYLEEAPPGEVVIEVRFAVVTRYGRPRR